MQCISRKQCFDIALAVVLIQVLIIFVSEIKLRLPFISNSRHALEDNIHGFRNDEPISSFLAKYREYCQHNLFPHQSNIPTTFTVSDYNTSLCQCVPDKLVGRMSVAKLELGNLSISPAVKPGGIWLPGDCIARHRVAVIIPYRDRAQHLDVLLSVLHPMLQRQQLYYTIFVIEQAAPDVFNKASLMNAGYVEASTQSHYDCFIFHDVDMIPEDDRNFYVCSHSPRHIGSHLSQWDYRYRDGWMTEEC
jgi:glycosyltransferase involved in cell wall biosynthesis